MTEANQIPRDEEQIKGICRMLHKIAELAEHASLTGTMEKGADVSLQQYNSSVRLLERMGATPAGFFPILEGASFDAIGAASAQLASFLGFVESAESGGVNYNGPKYLVQAPRGALNTDNDAKFSNEELAELRSLLDRHVASKD
jgi:hypothetical protein